MVETDALGMVPESLERTLRAATTPPKLVYLVPNFGNPTGVTLAEERRVAFVPGHAFFPHRDVTNAMRLKFSNMPPERIREGIKRLAEGLRV